MLHPGSLGRRLQLHSGMRADESETRARPRSCVAGGGLTVARSTGGSEAVPRRAGSLRPPRTVGGCAGLHQDSWTTSWKLENVLHAISCSCDVGGACVRRRQVRMTYYIQI
jgi:hypothetical protein